MKKNYLAMAAMAAMIAVSPGAQAADGDEMTAYLFAYFTGNSASQERVSYAISYDGFSYTPMNNGNPVIDPTDIALTGCVRDPHVLRGEGDGYFYMVLTDMQSSLGWSSNRGIVMMRSKDLINWESSTVHFPTRYEGTVYADVDRVWAPQTIWDASVGKYMVYFSLHQSSGTDIPYDQVFYAYANDDFTDLEGEPVLMYDAGSAAIDSDIAVDDSGTWHLFFKHEGAGGISQYTFAEEDLHDWKNWTYHSENINLEGAEGVGTFQLFDGSWCLMYDAYLAGFYRFFRSDDLYTFESVATTTTKGVFTPRHGTVMQITAAELEALEAAFPYVNNIANVTEEPVWLIQRGTGLHLEKESATSEQAVIASEEETGNTAGAQQVRFVKNDGYYNVVVDDCGTDYYLQQKGSNAWDTKFAAEGQDTDNALWSIEAVDDTYEYVVLRNKYTGGCLGSDNVTTGSHVYCDKSGSDVKHMYYYEGMQAANNENGALATHIVVAKGDDAVYDLQGRRLHSTHPGLNIVKAAGATTKVINH